MLDDVAGNEEIFILSPCSQPPYLVIVHVQLERLALDVEVHRHVPLGQPRAHLLAVAAARLLFTTSYSIPQFSAA